MILSLARLLVWLLLAVSLVVIGWDEPLRYKFMVPAQIKAEEAILRQRKPAPDTGRPVGAPLYRASGAR